MKKLKHLLITGLDTASLEMLPGPPPRDIEIIETSGTVSRPSIMLPPASPPACILRMKNMDQHEAIGITEFFKGLSDSEDFEISAVGVERVTVRKTGNPKFEKQDGTGLYRADIIVLPTT